MWISESFMVSHPSQTKLTVECQKDRDGELVKWSRVKGVDLSPKFKVAVKSFPSLQLFSRLSKIFGRQTIVRLKREKVKVNESSS